MTRDVRVLVVEDHPLMRDTTARFIDDADGMTVVGAVGSAEEALGHMGAPAAGDVDVVLLDLRLPGRNGIEAMGAIRSRYPEARVVVLTMLESEHARVRAAEVGASGFLTKGCAPDELVESVRRVAAGDTVGLGGATRRPPEAGALDADEVAVLRALIGSRSVAQIAGDLSLSLRAVTAVVGSIRTKTGATTRAEWLDYALRHELL